jgi:hypothetical protein
VNKGTSATGTAGYYTLPAMQLNTARYEVPKGARKLIRFLK